MRSLRTTPALVNARQSASQRRHACVSAHRAECLHGACCNHHANLERARLASCPVDCFALDRS
jgi:hypothetical protein